MSEEVLVQVADGVIEVTINQPEAKNAMSKAAAEGISAAMDRLETENDLRCAIITGAGGTFCSGMDLKGFLRGEMPVAGDRGFGALTSWTPKKPVIAAVDGFAYAGGMELALACDLRVVSETTTLGLAEVKRGLIPAAGGIARASRQLGWAAAAEILLVGDQISAAEAFRIGLVNRVVAADAVLPTAQALAEKMAQNSPLAMRKAKEAMIGSSGRPLEDAFGVEDQCIKVVLRSQDAREGSRAFMEKRKPDFTGT